MDSTFAPQDASSAIVQPRSGLFSRWFVGRRGRRLHEALLAYLFLFPAFLIVGTFGLFPLIFAAYQSTLRGLNKIVGTYDGLGNYVKAIDNLAYVLFFWIAVLLIYQAVRDLIRTAQASRATNQNPWPWALPGFAIGSAVALFVVFIFRLLPLLLEIPSLMRRQENTREIFRRLMWEAFTTAEVQQALWGAILALFLGVLLTYWLDRRQRPDIGSRTNYTGRFTSITVMLYGAALLIWLTWTEINAAYAEALESGEGLDIWSQILTISVGFLLLLIAWWIWESASYRQSNMSMAMRLGAAAMLMVSAWVLIGELPRAISAGDPVWWLGVQATFYYSLGTIPVQLGIALALATLLFQEIRGKSLFRIIYFIPYIAPFVGTAAVFRIIFSSRPTAPANSLLAKVGVDSLQWLNEPTGLFQMLAGSDVTLPAWAAGPSLALIVIMIYGTWTFVGFNTVIFMAGLGGIPREMYEVAAIDGAGHWSQFRHITLPLLSPTIYFLTLYAVIGTFKAFNHIYVLRTSAALGTTDTASVVIFQVFKRDTRFGYASALAILLLIIILMLTAVNNRLASKRVFYG